MPKTKKTTTPRARRVVKKTVPVESVAAPMTATACKKTACEQSCLLCWLFKIMIALFVLMIIFWLGFCFGSLASYMPNRAIIQSSKMSAPQKGFCMPTMDSFIDKMAASLNGKSGDNFDKEFLLQMSIHHEGAVAMAKKALESSARPEVKELAQSIIDSQSKETETMRSWLSDWFTKK